MILNWSLNYFKLLIPAMLFHLTCMTTMLSVSSTYQTIAGTIAFLPLAWSEREQWQIPSSTSLMALLYLGVFCSALAFLLYAYGLRKLSSSSAVALMNLVPVFGVASSVIVLAEPVSMVQLLGGSS